LIVFVVGTTSTGKTTFAEALAATLGSLAGPMPASVLRDNADDKPRPDLLEALPRRLVIAEELSAAQHLHPDQIKRLTGGSPVAARGMRSNTYVSKIPAFTPWLVTNSAPTILNADVALWRRIVAVPFDQQIKPGEEEFNYRERLMREAREAILAWVVEGYLAYCEAPESIFDIPTAAKQINADLRDEMSDTDAFLAEDCVRDARARITPLHLFEAYQEWCERNNIANRDRLSGVKFGKEISGKGFAKKQAKIDGHPVWFRVGIKLKNQQETSP
jgi:putative DNA primase/helicase